MQASQQTLKPQSSHHIAGSLTLINILHVYKKSMEMYRLTIVLLLSLLGVQFMCIIQFDQICMKTVNM